MEDLADISTKLIGEDGSGGLGCEWVDVLCCLEPYEFPSKDDYDEGEYCGLVQFHVESGEMMKHFGESRKMSFNFIDYEVYLTDNPPFNYIPNTDRHNICYISKENHASRQRLFPSIVTRPFNIKVDNYFNAHPEISENEYIPFDLQGDYIPIEKTEITIHQMPKKLIQSFYLYYRYKELSSMILRSINTVFRPRPTSSNLTGPSDPANSNLSLERMLINVRSLNDIILDVKNDENIRKIILDIVTKKENDIRSKYAETNVIQLFKPTLPLITT